MDIFGKVRAFPSMVRRGTPALQYGRGGYAFLVNKAERYVASGFFGFSKGYWREKAGFRVRGRFIPADLAVGAGLTGLGALLTVASGGRSKIATHLDAVGDAGMMSWLNSLGAAYGAKQSGRTVYVLDAGAKAPDKLPAGMTQVQGLPLASGGACLTDDEIAAALGPR